MHTSRWRRLLLCGAALVTVYAAVRLFWFSAAARPVANSAFFEGLLKVLVWVPPSLGVMMVWARASMHEAWRQLGLHEPVARGWVFGAIATLPMALAALLRGPWLPDLDDLVGTVLLGPFAEEVLFRGFLFTVLWRRVGWPWPVALAISATAFGLAHVLRLDLWTPIEALTSGYPELAYEILTYQLRLLVTLAGIPAAAGLLFGWVFYRWGSLWPAIGLHAAMNFWWAVSHPGDKTFSWEVDLAGVAQAATMVMAVVITLTSSKLEARRGA